MTVATTAIAIEAKKSATRHGWADMAAPAMAKPMTANGRMNIIHR